MKKYFNNETGEYWYLKFPTLGRAGQFIRNVGTKDGEEAVFPMYVMELVEDTELKFEKGEEIEVSMDPSLSYTFLVHFICETDDWANQNHGEDKYLVLTDDGKVMSFPYARKKQRMITVTIEGVLYNISEEEYEALDVAQFKADTAEKEYQNLKDKIKKKRGESY